MIRYDLAGNFGGVDIRQFKTGNKVRTVRLGFLNIPRLKLLKINVQGMEQGVIDGARNLIRQFKPLLHVENDRPE